MELFRGQISSPRISFSLDFAPSFCSSKVSPVRPIFDPPDDTEFEFRMSSNKLDIRSDAAVGAGESMVSADLLFSDGKLRPLLIPPPPPVGDCRLGSPPEHYLSVHKAHTGPGFDCSCGDHDPVPCDSGANCERSNPPRPPLPPVPSKSPRNYSAKIMKFFKPKKVPLLPCMEAVPAELSRHDSDTSSFKLPVSPKAFWPFLRSNSACETKTIAPMVPALPRRTNSASTTSSSDITFKSVNSTGMGKTNRVSSSSGVDSSVLQGKRNCFAVPIRGSERMKDREDSVTSIYPVPAAGIRPLSSTTQESCSLSLTFTSARKSSHLSLESRESAMLPKVSGTCASPKQSDFPSNAIMAFKDLKKTALMNAAIARGCGSPGRMARKRGSPGRRVISSSSGVQSNATRIVLRNLQRRSSGASLGVARKQQEAGSRDGRKAPVLDVAMYGKEPPKTGILSFGNMFSSETQKAVVSPLNNWRNGAE